MKLVYFFLLCFTNGINPTKGQLHLELSGKMLLRFVFHPNYNYYQKSCCKFTRYGCIIFVTSNGYVHNAYEGRIETYEYSGAFDVRIWNVHAQDAGMYRCEISGTQQYKDFQVVLTGSETELNPIQAFPKSTISPVSSAHNLLEKHQEISSTKWSLKFILGTIFGSLVIIVIMAISLAVVYYKKKSRDKHPSSFPSAPNVIQHPQELIYTTVDFKLHQKTSNIYANLDIHTLGPGSSNAFKAQDSVEYATIAGAL
ncbi:uncharacterized protein LOC131352996 isoform X2 [Hemibagrus wyckioides]|uniref:uncharacterized protein LOC131352996 isoform X2 n=1 Tax=Hemibagrus wyckioides TaxID=337641 RepID=UPI00266D53B4|nr:uncharacterized protein LOC131352996 isoform X2 [Hemibagrus wyckioides]